MLNRIEYNDEFMDTFSIHLDLDLDFIRISCAKKIKLNVQIDKFKTTLTE